MKTKEISRKNMYIFMIVSSIILVIALIGIFYIKNVYANDIEESGETQKVSVGTNIEFSNASEINIDDIILKNSSERKM